MALFIVFTSTVERSDFGGLGMEKMTDRTILLLSVVRSLGWKCLMLEVMAQVSLWHQLNLCNMVQNGRMSIALKPFFFFYVNSDNTIVILSSIFHTYNLITDQHELFLLQCCIH